MAQEFESGEALGNCRFICEPAVYEVCVPVDPETCKPGGHSCCFELARAFNGADSCSFFSVIGACGSDSVPTDAGIHHDVVLDMESDEGFEDIAEPVDRGQDTYVPPVVKIDERTVDRSVRGFRAPAFYNGLIYGVNNTSSSLPMVLAIEDDPDQVAVRGFAAAAEGSTAGVVGPERAFLTSHINFDPVVPDGLWLWTIDTTTWDIRGATDIGCARNLPDRRRPLIEDSGRLFIPCGYEIIEVDVADLEEPSAEDVHPMESWVVQVVSASVSEDTLFSVLRNNGGAFIFERVRIDAFGTRTSRSVAVDEALGAVHDYQWSGDSLWVLTHRDILVEIDTSGQDFEVDRILELRDLLETFPDEVNTGAGGYSTTLAVAGDKVFVPWIRYPAEPPVISFLAVIDVSGSDAVVESEHPFDLGPTASRIGLRTGAVHDNAFYLFHNVERGGGAPFTRFSFEELNISTD